MIFYIPAKNQIFEQMQIIAVNNLPKNCEIFQ